MKPGSIHTSLEPYGECIHGTMVVLGDKTFPCAMCDAAVAALRAQQEPVMVGCTDGPVRCPSCGAGFTVRIHAIPPAPVAQEAKQYICDSHTPPAPCPNCEPARQDSLPPVYTAPAASEGVTMADAVAAGDGTLHGAINYWQKRALAAESALRQPVAGEQCRPAFRRERWCATHDGPIDLCPSAPASAEQSEGRE